MEQETKKPNKVMFWVGITIVIISVIFLLIGEEFKIWPVPVAIIGIVFIGTSRYRPLKKLF